MLLLIFFAFIAGIVTILSPCILPVLPIVLSGSLTGGKRRPFGIITGFILSFTFFTLFSFALLKVFGISPEVLRLIAIIFLALFGLSLFFPSFQVWLEKLGGKFTKNNSSGKTEGFQGGLFVGLTLGLFWTPCVGPILASVITLAATSTVTLQALFITLAYAIGTALPMFFITYGGRRLLNAIPWVTRNTAKIQKVFALLMILFAGALYFNLDRTFQTYILEKFPSYGSGLTKFEETSNVENALQNLNGPTAFSGQGESENTDASAPLAPNPSFMGGGTWLNSDPLTLEKLRGKVVLIDFWTYTCINCIRTLPHVTGWYEKYKDLGLVVIGVHTPEFAIEQKTENVRAAMERFGIHYPVVQDNDYGIWNSYGNHYWPAEYFIDRTGHLRKTHFGEGEYAESEEFLQTLLSENGTKLENAPLQMPDTTPNYPTTPESYLGAARLERFASPEEIKVDQEARYSAPAELPLDSLAYSGFWNIGAEQAVSSKDAALQLHFQGKSVYLVMSGEKTAKGRRVRVILDGKPVEAENAGDDVKDGMLTVTEDRLYTLLKFSKAEDHTLTLQFLDPGSAVFAFTFG